MRWSEVETRAKYWLTILGAYDNFTFLRRADFNLLNPGSKLTRSLWGRCNFDTQSFSTACSRISKKRLDETLVHEILHLSVPDAEESWVENAATIIAGHDRKLLIQQIRRRNLTIN